MEDNILNGDHLEYMWCFFMWVLTKNNGGPLPHLVVL